MTINSSRKASVPLILILGSLLVARLCFWLMPDGFGIWNAQASDQLFVLRSSSQKLRPFYDNTVVHVDFNNSSIQRLNDNYLNRTHLAQLIRNLASMKVSRQVFDFILAARIEDEKDQALIRATREAGNVYFGMVFELHPQDHIRLDQPPPPSTARYLEQTRWDITVQEDAGSLFTGRHPLITFYDLAAAARALGSLSIKFDRDGVLRRVPLLVRYQGGYYPLLPFRVICDYLGVPPQQIILKPGHYIRLQDAKRPDGGRPHDIVIPIDRHGNMIINFIGPWERMDHYDFVDILKAAGDRDELEIWSEELNGKIVIISDVSTGSTDVGPVPADTDYPLCGAQANIIHSILTESFLRELSGWEMLGVEAFMATLVLWLALRFSSVFFTIGAAGIAAAFLVLAGSAFFYAGTIFNIVRPLLMLALATGSIVVYRYINEEKEKMESLRQRDFIRDTFGRYLSNEVVQELLESPGGLKMSGETREVTFLVSDLRGFTALTSRLSPHEVIEVINRYFEHMVEIIAGYRGTVSQFLGDGILTFFGAPLQAEDDPHRAVACALAMQNAMAEVNAEQRRLNLPELAMGIGINTGEVVAGNIGSEKRASYGAVGSAINMAYRIESYTVGGQILISPSTYEKVRALVQVQGTTALKFKGIDQPVRLYDVSGIDGRYQVALAARQPETPVKLDRPVPIQCFALDGKIISTAAIAGQITRLGRTSAEVSLAHPVPVYANLRILLAPQAGSADSELYAKVLPGDGSDSSELQTQIRIHFTWVSADAQKFLASRHPAER